MRAEIPNIAGARRANSFQGSNNNVVENAFFTKAVPNYNDRITIINTQKAEQDNDNTLFDGNGNTISTSWCEQKYQT